MLERARERDAHIASETKKTRKKERERSKTKKGGRKE